MILRAFAAAALLAGAAWAQEADPLAAAIAKTRSTDALTRRGGAEALATIRKPEAAAALKRLVTLDPSANVRQTAASSLGLFGDGKAAGALVAALKDSSAPVRFAAVRSLGALRAASAAGALGALLSDPDASMRRTAAAALGQIASPRSRAALNAALNDSDEGVRLEASSALARLGEGGGLTEALKGLRSKDPSSRRRAATAAALSGDSSALGALDAAFAAEKDAATKAAIDEDRARLRERLSANPGAAAAPKNGASAQ